MSSYLFGKNNPAWKGGHFICLDCKKTLSSRRSLRCRSCRSVYLSSLKGNKNPNWKGGFSRYEITKRWTKSHLEKARYLKHCQRVARSRAEGSHTLLEWQNLKSKYNYMCLCCKKYEPEITLTPDHIIPIAKGGSDYIRNIQPLCRKCNSVKMVNTTSYLPIGISSSNFALPN